MFYKYMNTNVDNGKHVTKRLVKNFTKMNILYDLKIILRSYKQYNKFILVGCGGQKTVLLDASEEEPRNSVYRLMQGLQELFPKVGLDVFHHSFSRAHLSQYAVLKFMSDSVSPGDQSKMMELM